MEIAETGLRSQIAALLPDLRAFARFLVRDRASADDLLQDALVRALAALDQFQPGTSLKAWLFTILRNAFYEGARRRRREARALEAQGLEAQGRADQTADPAQDAQAEVQDLQRLIWTLPPRLREALILVGAQEMTYEEAALVCDVPVGTIKARVSRGRAALQAAMRRAESLSNEGHAVADT